VTAATDSGVTAATPDTDEVASEKSQTVVFMLAIGPNDVQLERLGQFELDGPARGLGIHRGTDGPNSRF